MSFGTSFSEPYYLGTGVATEAGLAYEVSLGGLPYNLDKTREFTHSSVQLLRATIDEKENVGLNTLNPEAFWRRGFESWHVGAGQTHFDRVNESSPYRFRRSKGINVWDRNQFSLLNAVDSKLTVAPGSGLLAVAGDFLYTNNNTTLYRTSDVTVGTPTFTSVTGTPGTNPSSIASDGFNVLTAHGASGIYKTTRGAATTASHITGTVAHVAYGKGRWIATSGPTLYDITTLVAGAGPVALPAAHYTHPNTDFTWSSFCEGPSAFYAGGVSGDKSLVYRLTMKEDGTGLNQPVVAAFLPDGEILYSLAGYLGFVLLGTSKGVRVGIVGGNGDLTVGAFIPTGAPVRCFEGQEQFVWFGWSQYEGTDGGLGRINLETFSDPESLAPAYASDLMAGTQSNATACVTFQDRRVFTVDNGALAGVYAEEPGTLVASGEIDTGLFDYGLVEEKLSLYVDTSHVSHEGGSHEILVSLDRGSFVSLGSFTDDHFPVATGEARAHEFELRYTLARDGVDASVGPVVRTFALRAHPATPMTEQFVIPLLIGPQITRIDGFDEPTDSLAMAENIVNLCRTKEVTVYQEGARSWSVIVDAYQAEHHDVWVAHDSSLGVNATYSVRLKTVT